MVLLAYAALRPTVILGEGVCRGSLIIHQGETYVVVGAAKCRYNRPGKRDEYRPGWVILAVESAEAGLITSRQTINITQEVEMVFPGAVYPLNEYIV